MKINLGAGAWKLAGRDWVSVDADKRSKPEVIHDLRCIAYPFKDNVASFIFASHIIEHLTYRQAEDLLRESFRILAPGGVIRIATPDYLTAFTKYTQGKFAEWFKKIMESEKTWPDKNYPTDLLALSEEFIYAGAPHPLGHKSVWDIPTIIYFLKKVGCSEAFKSNYNDSAYPELKGIDNRSELSIYAEGVK